MQGSEVVNRERIGIMKKRYLIGLFAGCTLLMMGCSNREKNPVNNSNAPAITDGTGLTEGEADVAGQGRDMNSGTVAGNGQNDASNNAAVDNAGNADTTGSPAASTAKKSKSTTKNPSNKTESKKQTSSSSQEEDIGMEAAKKIALGKAGLTEQDGSWKEEKKEREKGRLVYDLEFVSGKIEHEFEIDAQDGKILEYKQDPH